MMSKRRTRTGNVVPIPVHPDDTNDFWIVNRTLFNYATSAQSYTHFLYFEREESITQNAAINSFLASTGKTILRFYGPPGVGKTLRACISILHLFTTIRNNVLMIFLPPKVESTMTVKGYICSYLDGVSITIGTEVFRLSSIVEVCHRYGCDLALIDNVTDETAPIVNGCLLWGLKTIAVSSLSVDLAISKRITSHLVESGWTLQEYISACNYASFYNRVMSNIDDATATDNDETRIARLTAKFSIAGHCARYMFGLSSGEVLSLLGEYVEKAPHNFPDLMFDGQSEAVKPLLSRMNGDVVLVSQYVSKLLGWKYREPLIYVTRNLLTNINFNHGADGTIMETDFLIHLGRDSQTALHPITLVGRLGEPNVVLQSGLPSDVILYLNPSQTNTNHHQMINRVVPATLGALHWFVPLIVNDAGFDFVQWQDRTPVGGARCGVLKFVQVTRSETHSFHRDHYNTLYSWFVAKYRGIAITCEVYFVVRVEIVNQFALNATKSDGTLANFAPGHEKIVGFYRTGGE